MLKHEDGQLYLASLILLGSRWYLSWILSLSKVGRFVTISKMHSGLLYYVVSYLFYLEPPPHHPLFLYLHFETSSCNFYSGTVNISVRITLYTIVVFICPFDSSLPSVIVWTNWMFSGQFLDRTGNSKWFFSKAPSRNIGPLHSNCKETVWFK